MSIKLNGSNSGSIEIDVPADAGLNTAITFPATSGEVIVSDTSGDVDLGPLTIDGAASDGSVNLDSSGRLLVGTSSTSGNERIYCAASSSTTAGLYIHNTNGSTNSSADIWFGNYSGASTGNIYNARISAVNRNAGNAQTDLAFYTYDGSGSSSGIQERMRIESNGFTSIWGTNNVNTINLLTPTAAGTIANLIWGGHSSTGPGNYGTNCFLVRTNGNVENTNNSYGAISDIKLKENIVDANSQWDDLKALQVRNYNFKAGQTHTQIGLIAQEAELVSPGLVSESPDRDENGNDLGTVTKSVNYSVLYMKAVKALQEAMERIETLEAEVTALKGGAS